MHESDMQAFIEGVEPYEQIQLVGTSKRSLATRASAFFNNLFGTIGQTSVLTYGTKDPGFIPKDANGGTIKLKGEFAASWLGLQIPLQQLYAYDFCYPLSSVVDALAEADISGQTEIYIAGTKGKGNLATSSYAKSLRKLLLRPNPMQTWEQFRGQQKVYMKVFGFCPVMPIVPFGFGPEDATSMVNLPPWLFDATPTYNYLYESTIQGIVKEYKVSILGKQFTLKPEQVFILEDSFMQNYKRNFLLPQSRLVGLDMAVSNICAAMEADNVLLRKKGPLGFISHDPTASSITGHLPMRPGEKQKLQKQLEQYGMGWDQFQYVISRTPTRWNPMSYNTKELGTKETILAGARAICQRYKYPYVLYEDSDATFSNQESAHKKLYDNNVIPNNVRDMAKYMEFFKCRENNCMIKTDYTHLAIFKEDELNVGRARAYADQGLQIEYLNNIITKNQWLEELDLPTLGPEGDKYYYQSTEKLASDQQKADQMKASKDQLDALNNQNQPVK